MHRSQGDRPSGYLCCRLRLLSRTTTRQFSRRDDYRLWLVTLNVVATVKNEVMPTRDVGGGNLILQPCGQRAEGRRLARCGLRTRQNDGRYIARLREHLDFGSRRRDSRSLAIASGTSAQCVAKRCSGAASRVFAVPCLSSAQYLRTTAGSGCSRSAARVSRLPRPVPAIATGNHMQSVPIRFLGGLHHEYSLAPCCA